MLHKLLLAIFLVLISCSAAFSAPRLVQDETRYDFGVVTKGDKVEHRFTFRNEGDEPLVIDNVKSSCSCTATLVTNKEIPPGESGSVEAVFDSARFRGRIHKTIFVFSNDPQQPSSQFLLEGEVALALQAVPAQLNFGTLHAGEESQQRLVVKNISSKTLRLVNVRSSNAALKVDWQEAELQPGEEVEMTATLKAQISLGTIGGTVLIRTDRADVPEFQIPARAIVQKR